MCTDGQPRTSCVLMDTHGHTDSHGCLCVLTHTHGRPACADGHPRMSCPTWAEITRTVLGKGQHAESKDQRADMCTDGQPRTSCPQTSCVLTDTRTAPDVLCVLTDTHGRLPVLTDTDRAPGKGQHAESKDQRADMCTYGQPRTSCVSDGQTRTHTDSHGHHMCTDVLCVLADTHGHTRVLNRQPTSAKITQTVHEKGQRAKSKDQRADMYIYTDEQPRTSLCVLTVTHGHTWTATDVLCADGHTWTSCGVLTDTHGRPVCADRHPRTSYSPGRPCVLADTHGRPVCTEQTAHVGQNHPNSPGEGPASLSRRTNMLICVLMDSHGRSVCADGHKQTHTDSHGCPVCADRHPRMSCTAHVGRNHPNSPREGPAC
ncbi:unnamed protein product [Brassica rapa]|uniref:Uncharacterized protein n=1 Tax=Brassica campestris TaxID=3711 RepID=A0A8D9CQN7_BRACM|nr:unnamed protein product [Brassica rapa]